MKTKTNKRLSLKKITVSNLASIDQEHIKAGAITPECPSDEHSDCISLCGSVEPCSVYPACK